ncbi:hypothetical protein [Chitinophaga silvisoli]|uniref:Outer membrane protein beta-barrel domain-containing protein n=1 Tax=Chitinophaga silvisoli TaxID=2291814 RepID=A0A3E1NUZ6_9BACT|nr:hypothetical protein [Chitinophaga silvisoli]RFM31771.1 hypothetical protein DXN04_26780 [Chitinophaga silvisoli]
MKKFLLLAAIALSCIHSSFAQRFKQGVGAGFSVETADYMDTKVNFGFTYSPALFFAEAEKSSFSVGIPLSLGFNEGYSSEYDDYDDFYGSSSIGFMLDVPVILNFNYGAGALSGGRQKWGFFVGGGYGYHLTTANYLYDYDDNGNYRSTESSTFGVTANAGFRIGMGHHHRHNLEIKFSYMKGLTDYRPDVGGVNCIFNF